MSLEQNTCLVMGILEGKWDIVNKFKSNGKNLCIICFNLCLYLCLTFMAECCCKGRIQFIGFLYNNHWERVL
jgi:hypothetical protein